MVQTVENESKGTETGKKSSRIQEKVGKLGSDIDNLTKKTGNEASKLAKNINSEIKSLSSEIKSIDVKDEVKHTLIPPNTFSILAGTFDNPSITIINPSGYVMDPGEGRPLQEMPISAVALAESIIRDYCSGLLGFALDKSMFPILFILTLSSTTSTIALTPSPRDAFVA